MSEHQSNIATSRAPSGLVLFYYLSIGFVLGSLPFFSIIKSVPIIILGVAWLAMLFTGNVSFRRYDFVTVMIAMLPLTIILSESVVTLANGNKVTVREVEKYSSMLIPLMIISGPIIDLAAIKKVMRIFVGGIVVAGVICLIFATLKSIQHGSFYEEWSEFRYRNWFFLSEQLTEVINAHPSYLSYMISVAILFILYFEKLKGRTYGVVAFLALFLVLLAARSLWIFTGVSVLILLLSSGRFKAKTVLLGASVALVISLVLIFSVQGIRTRFTEIRDIHFDYTAPHHTQWNGLTTRLAVWTCAGELIEERPLFGYGLNSQENLMEKYLEKKFLYVYDQNLNTHNQFVGTALYAGLFGVACLLMWMISPMLRRQWREEDRPFALSLFIVTAGAFLFENYLERSMGILVIVIVYTLFILGPKKSAAIQ